MKAKTEGKAKTAAAKTESKAAAVSSKVSAVKDKAMGEQYCLAMKFWMKSQACSCCACKFNHGGHSAQNYDGLQIKTQESQQQVAT